MMSMSRRIQIAMRERECEESAEKNRKADKREREHRNKLSVCVAVGRQRRTVLANVSGIVVNEVKKN